MVATTTSPEAETAQVTPWRRRGRRVVLAVLAYVALIIVAQVLSAAMILAGRLFGDDARTSFPGIDNFRVVDDEVWAGAQPSEEGLGELAAQGVRLVVDLRTGAGDDPREDDPSELRRLGLDYLSLAVPDGHVPSRRQVERFVDAVRRTDGVVFVHCGGGVGRTSAMTSAYGRAIGERSGFFDHATLGPHTVAQLWFVATDDRNPVVQRISEVIDAPRRLWSRLR